MTTLILSLAILRASVVNINADWRFRLDASNQGVTARWFSEEFDDSGWTVIQAGRSWEEQGFAGRDGVGWYRRRVHIPSDWRGSPVRLAASGIDDEYDLYVNGRFVRHFGEAPERSVWNWQTYSRIDSFVRYGEDNLLAIRVNDWGGGGGIVKDIALRRAVPLEPYKDRLPEPVLESRPEWVHLYWEAWRMAWEKISFGTSANGLAEEYMDEGFNEQIYQWDSVFMTLFARYGARLFPVMPTLDNFYARQRPDGYIQRCYSETHGGEIGDPTAEEPLINPPLFAWAEREYLRFTGDTSRLERVVPVLEKYYRWLKDHARSPHLKELYYQTDLGSGMDNCPRGDVAMAGWVDMSLQQALAARCLAELCDARGDSARARTWRAEHESLKDAINARMWHREDGFYYDLRRDGSPARVKHIGAFWSLLSGVAEDREREALLPHLFDEKEFRRPHLFPTLAASESTYVADGHYWRGSVWAPTNYMVIKGLEQSRAIPAAAEAAENHIARMREVYDTPPQDETRIAPEERREQYRTIWECYSSERAEPATRWDNRFYSRQDFVGWSGLGPIALLFENVIGLSVRGDRNEITWTLLRTDRHGAKRMPLGREGNVELIAEPRAAADVEVTIRVRTNRAFRLILRRPGAAEKIVEVERGEETVKY